MSRTPNILKTLAIAVAAVLLLTACGRSFLSGSSSMRIDVFVYKGPLSNTPDIQKGQLATVLNTANAALNDMDSQLVASMCRIGCVKRATPIIPTMIPTVKTCQELGIPQRRRINHDAWLGKSYKPALVGFSDGRTAENASVLLKQQMPRYDGKCRNAQGVPTTPGAEQSCKGGFFGHFQRLVTKESELEARPEYNRKNSISMHEKFPEYASKTYRVCPVYTRLRTQVDTLKGQTAQSGLVMRGATGFLETVDQSAAIKRLENLLSSKLSARKEIVCKQLSGSAKNACNDAFNTYSAAIASLKTTSGSALDPYLGQTELLDDAEAKTTLAAFVSLVDQLRGNAQSASLAAENAATQVSSSLRSYGVRRAISDYASQLRKREVSIRSFPNKIETESKITSAYDAVMDLTLPNSEDDLKEALESRASTVETLIAAANTQKKRAKEVTNTLETALTTDNGALAAYLLRKDFNVTTLVRGGEAANQLSERILSFMPALDEKTGLRKTLHEVTAALHEQEESKKQYSDNREKPAEIVSSAITDAQTPNDVANEFRDSLKLLESAVTIGMSTDWSPDETKLKLIRTKIDEARTIFAAIVTEGQFKNGTTETDNTKKLKAVLTNLSGQSFPELSFDKYNTVFVTKRNELAARINPTGTPPTFKELAGNLAETYSDIANEVRDYRKVIAPDGLREDEAGVIATLSDVRTKLDEQNKEFGAIAQQLSSTLDAARAVQAANDNAAYRIVAQIAGSFRILATTISFQIAAVEPPEKRLLIDLAKAANVAAEYANQLTARANALSLQAEGLDRRIISTGQYLRDTQPTAFLDMYDWLNAATEDGKISPRDRVSVAKRLFDDDNWAKQPSVYASGAGETTMAFIRDEIGNWNLKSFENDPTELTQAYAKLGVDLVERAADLAATGGSGEGARQITNLLRNAQEVQTGAVSTEQKAGALIGDLDLATIRDDLKGELGKIASDFNNDLEEAKKVTPPAAPQPADASTTAEPEPDEAATAQAVAAAEQAARDKARRRAAAVVTRYSDLINALQRVVAAKPDAQNGTN